MGGEQYSIIKPSCCYLVKQVEPHGLYTLSFILALSSIFQHVPSAGGSGSGFPSPPAPACPISRDTASVLDSRGTPYSHSLKRKKRKRRPLLGKGSQHGKRSRGGLSFNVGILIPRCPGDVLPLGDCLGDMTLLDPLLTADWGPDSDVVY